MPNALHEFMAEIGRKGGSRKTEAQSYALAKGANVSRAVRSAQSIGRKTQIQALKEAGYTQKQIAEKLNLNVRYSAASLELSLGRHLRSLIRVLRFRPSATRLPSLWSSPAILKKPLDNL